VADLLRRVLGAGGGGPRVAPEAEYVDIARYEREGPAPLAAGAGDRSSAAALEVAVVVPWLIEGSGGHATILNLVRALERRGHSLSLWVYDPAGRGSGDVATQVREWFGGMEGPVVPSLDGWAGADVVVATGWQTVHAVAMLPGVRARAYLVQDHEAEFHPTSAESRWADETYRLGFHCITAGRWLRDLVAQNYGATASWFDLGVDFSLYRPLERERDEHTVLFYSRTTTPRRAVPLGLLALAELKRRMPAARVQLFGDPRQAGAAFEHQDLGVLSGEDLVEAYARATVGMVLSLTNYSLVAQEMLACGLPVVELDTPSMRSAFGAKPPLELAPFGVQALAGALERLLGDPELRAARRAAGLHAIEKRTWAAAGEQVEAGLREALRLASE
jgi:glycosyltransferase involved in cell wall biosynthesis